MRCPRFLRFCLRWLFLLTASLFQLVVYLVCALVLYLCHDLPPVPDVNNPEVLRAAFGIERVFEPVPYAAIPKPVVQAFLAAHDARYFDAGYSQSGCLYGVLFLFREGAAFYCNMSFLDQLGRSLLQAETRDAPNYRRLLRRCALEYKLRLFLSKTEILGLYLNTVYLGNSHYGVQAASRLYFCKALDELTPAEAACLAVLPHAPSRYNPFTHPALLQERRDWLLDRMAALAFLTPEEAAAAKAVPVGDLVRGSGNLF